jgi:hypothetical protein
MSNSKIHKKSL